MIKEAIAKVVEGKSLSAEEAGQVMQQIMEGQASPAQIACYLTALRLKGETVEEITGCARAMREKATYVQLAGKRLVDTCGTGGDGAHTFNISTTAAFVAAGAGVVIAKHGNRSVSSLCGSADVLKELGVNIEVDVPTVEACLREVGIGFLFAPLLHPAMKHAIGPRREIGIRTIFNILGPLTNPARAQAQLLGVYKKELTPMMAQVLGNLGAQHALVVHGDDGLDEITTTTFTHISEWKNGKVTTYRLNPKDVGIAPAKKEDLAGGDPAANARITLEILQGKKGPQRDVVLLNAAAALVVADEAKNLEEGIKLAAHSIDSGSALAKLEALKARTNKV
jgi:anthranilate phosphoribosyltransferase